jgi:hypothetical protein
MFTSSYSRNRWWLVALGLVVIALGLASRKFAGLFPIFVGNYPGDALWALTAYLVIAFVVPSMPVWKLAVVALLASYAVEFSQLFHAPWINDIRGTRAGHLLLGQGFDWLDLVAQTVGVGVGVSVDAICGRNARFAALALRG